MVLQVKVSIVLFIFSLRMKRCCDWSLAEKLKNRRKILNHNFLISAINKYADKAKSFQLSQCLITNWNESDTTVWLSSKTNEVYQL